MVKYADRGLADDVFWHNMDFFKNFKMLFWVLNTTVFVWGNSMLVVFYIKHGQSRFANNPR